jgi:transposase
LDGTGQRRVDRVVPHTGAGLAALVAELLAVESEPARIAVGLEVPRGAVVETLLERGFHVFALNPKQLARFRERYSVAGAKDDRRDAYVAASALRTDRAAFRRVQADHPAVVELRELSRLDDDLGQELRRLSNRLRDLLQRFYPQALGLCPAADEPWFWAVLERAPTPAAAQRLPSKAVRAVLTTYRIRRLTVDAVRAALQAPPLHVAPGVVTAASTHLALLLPRLRLADAQRAQVGKRIEALLTHLADEEAQGEHHDVAILRSCPGAGRLVAATVLAEAPQALAQRDYQRLRLQGGVAPVTRQSGKTRLVAMRQACNPRLRNALFHWARVSVQVDPHCRAHYDRLRQRGHSHARALRGVGDRCLRVLIALLHARTLYDPAHRPQLAA